MGSKGISNISVRVPFFSVEQILRDICRVSVLVKRGISLHQITNPSPIGNYSFHLNAVRNRQTDARGALMHKCDDHCMYLFEHTNKIYYCLANDLIHFCGYLNCDQMETVGVDSYVCLQTAVVIGAPQMMSYTTMESQDNPYAVSAKTRSKAFISTYFFEEDSLFDRFKRALLSLASEAGVHKVDLQSMRFDFNEDRGGRNSKVCFIDTVGTENTFYHRTKKRWSEFKTCNYSVHFYVHCIACLYSEEKHIITSKPTTQKWIRSLLIREKSLFKKLMTTAGVKKRRKFVYRHLTTALKAIRNIMRIKSK